MNTKLLLISFSSLFILAGCNLYGDGSSSTSSSVKALSDVAADSDAIALDDVTSLSRDLKSIFGVADGEPIPVEDNDSVQDVIDRGRS